MERMTFDEFRSALKASTRAWHLELKDTYNVASEDEPFRRFIEQLIGKIGKRSPVHADRKAGTKIFVDCDRLVGIQVIDLHEPTRRVAAHGKRGKIDRPEPLADVQKIA